MAKKKNSASPVAKGAILLVIVGVPAFFALASMGTSALLERAPYILVLVCAIIAGIYNGMTCKLLYDYYESNCPWYAWIPCYGELALMDSKYILPGTIAYAIAIVSLVISQLPYRIIGALGDIALTLPFYATVVFFIAMLVVEVVKGLGTVGCVKVVSEEWEEKMHGSLGFIKSFGWLGFIPFVRVMATYGLNKPLSTLVTFNDMTVNDDDSIELSEEGEESE